jgi:hypothetical protein
MIDIIHKHKTYEEKIKNIKYMSNIFSNSVCLKNNNNINILGDIPIKYKNFKIIKEEKYKNSEILFLYDKINKIYFIVKEDKTNSDKNNVKEIYNKINSIISSGKNPNFISTFCVIYLSKKRNLYFQEYYSYDFYNLLKNHNGFNKYNKIKIFINIIQRILLCIINLLDNDIIHNDLHLKNILINKSDDYSDTEFYNKILLNSYGYSVAITDFNNSFIKYNTIEVNNFLMKFFALEFLKFKNKINKTIIYCFDLYIFLISIKSTISDIMNNNLRNINNIIHKYIIIIKNLINESIKGKTIKKNKIYDIIVNIVDSLFYEDSNKKIKMNII